jgi:transposase
LIRQQVKETPEKSDRQTATGLGVANSTVSRTREKMEDEGELLQSHSSIGADGKERPRQVERKPITLYNPDKSSLDSVKEEIIEKAAPELSQAAA